MNPDAPFEPDKMLSSVPRFDAWVWSRVLAGSEPDLTQTYLEFRSPGEPEPLTVATVVSATEPLRLLFEYSGEQFSRYANAGQVGALLVSGGADGPFVVSSWPDQRPGIYHLAATVPSTDRRWRKLERWLDKSAPDVVPVYLDRRDFEGFVSVFGEHGDVDASRLTGRYRTDQSSYSRGWPNPKNARAALEEVAEEVQLRTMTLTVLSERDSAVLLRVHLRRTAGATLYNGDFEIFRKVVLERLASAAEKRIRLFSNRFRTAETPSPRPLEVRVGLPRFDDASSMVDFLERVERFTDSDVAILHRNPYLQVALTDYLDGSNFDIFVTSSDRITVIPGFQASVGALVRLTDFLSEEFEADGVADELAAEPVSLEELFSSV